MNLHFIRILIFILFCISPLLVYAYSILPEDAASGKINEIIKMHMCMRNLLWSNVGNENCKMHAVSSENPALFYNKRHVVKDVLGGSPTADRIAPVGENPSALFKNSSCLISFGIFRTMPVGEYSHLYPTVNEYVVSGESKSIFWHEITPLFLLSYSSFNSNGKNGLDRTSLTLFRTAAAARYVYSFNASGYFFNAPLQLAGEADAGIAWATFNNRTKVQAVCASVPTMGFGMQLSSLSAGIYEFGISLRGGMLATQGPKFLTLSYGVFAGVEL